MLEWGPSELDMKDQDLKMIQKIDHIGIAVKNLDEAMKMVKAAGGKILGEPMDIPGIGKYIAFRDTEGNRVGMLQPSR